jgi:predicted enzyme related to lactoylglutathione lyase
MIKSPIVGLLLLACVTACAATGFSIPPVTDVTGGERLPGKLIWQDLLTDTPDRTRNFYSELFGWEFEPLACGVNYTIIRHHGEMIGGMVDQNQLPTKADISQWVVAMSVTDVEKAVALVAAAGGAVFTPATSLGDRGDIAVVADPAGALLALLQTRNGDPADPADIQPRSGDFLWRELWTKDPQQAADFYRQLAPFEETALTLPMADAQIDYRVLTTANRPRVGIRPTPVLQMPPMWVSYLRVADEDELAVILSKVPALGGDILVPAVARPGGGHMAVIAGPSGAGIALQTWADAPVQASREEQQ